MASEYKKGNLVCWWKGDLNRENLNITCFFHEYFFKLYQLIIFKREIFDW